jgi:hypothetical protein
MLICREHSQVQFSDVFRFAQFFEVGLFLPDDQDSFPAETTLPANQRFPDGGKVLKVIKQGADNIRRTGTLGVSGATLEKLDQI